MICDHRYEVHYYLLTYLHVTNMSFLLCFLGETHSLKTLNVILSTGSPLKPASYDYVYEHIKEDLLLGSITGSYGHSLLNVCL